MSGWVLGAEAMVSSSAIINKPLRKHVAPVVRSAGLQKVDARNGWAWFEPCIWVFNIRAVCSYCSQVSGWPADSVGI